MIHITRLSDIRLPTVETLGYYQPPTDFQSIQITCILPDRIGRKIRQFLILYPVLVSTTFKLQTLNTSNNYNINNISHFCWFCCKNHQNCCIIFSEMKIIWHNERIFVLFSIIWKIGKLKKRDTAEIKIKLDLYFRNRVRMF